MKVLLVDTVHPILPQRLQALGFAVVEDYHSTPPQVLEKIHQYQGLIIRSRFPVGADVIHRATNLKFIGRVGAGLENINLAAAEQASVKVFKAPEGNRDAVGEHALAMLLMLFNNLKRADAEVRKGQWQRAENRGFELRGKTVGIVGFGYMGSAFAEKLRGFNCRILAYDKYKTQYAPDGVEEVSLEQLQAQADVLSLHIPQSEETLGWVDTSFFEAFSKPLYLINTARGKQVVTQDLVDALRSGQVIGACLDVLEYEKSSFENMFTQTLPAAFEYLIESERVILSPHIAGWTHESHQRMALVIAEKVEAFLQNS